MPRHQQVTTCRRHGGPVSKMCTCAHCALTVCSVCGGVEGTLTTDCPGTPIAADRLQELYETPLDYTDARGWYLAQPADLQVKQQHYGETSAKRSPRFESTDVPPARQPPDPRGSVAPNINWPVIARLVDLKSALAQKAIDWVLADRVAEDHSAKLTCVEHEVAEHLPKGQEPSAHAQKLLKELEDVKVGFHLASQRAEQADDEFRQLARRLVTELEAAQDHDRHKGETALFTRTCGCTAIADGTCPHFVAAQGPTPR